VANYEKDIRGPGPPDKISDEIAQQHIIPWINNMQQTGRPVSKLQLRKAVGEWITYKKYMAGDPLKYKDGKPVFHVMSEDWAQRFLKRHNLSQRKASKLKSGTGMVTDDNLMSLYNLLGQLVEQRGFHAYQVWNIDETHLAPCGPSSDVIVPTGTKKLNQHHDEHSPHVSLTGFCSATGQIAVCAIVPQKSDTSDLSDAWKETQKQIKDIMPAGANFKLQASTSGWQTSSTFTEALRFLRSFTAGELLVLVDAHSTHIGIEATTYAEANQIFLVSFPANASVLIQPLDKGVYSPFKSSIRAQYNVATEKEINNVNKLVLLGMRAWRIAVTEKPENIVNAFADNGIFPVDAGKRPRAPAAILGTRLCRAACCIVHCCQVNLAACARTTNMNVMRCCS